LAPSEAPILPFHFPVELLAFKRRSRKVGRTTAYLACGAPDAPLIVFLHGWPELAISWRHQLPVFTELGFLCVAPDLRGYGRSSIYDQQTDYALEYGVRDMLELLDSLGREKAGWVGHDVGSLVAWTVATITRSAAMVLSACAYLI
jgi:pimeloyl-ACP methyl ester carboxylesterase